MCAAGVPKLIEECGELIQVLGKKLAWWNTNEPHWDGSDLDKRIVEEMGDVMAAIDFAATKLGLDYITIARRRLAKLAVFQEWDADPSNNDHGVDRGAP